jgi:hypothetical protein
MSRFVSRQPRDSGWFIAALASALLFCAPGCCLVPPEVSPQPQGLNLCPRLIHVAIAPFFNQSDEPTLDGHRFSLAFFAKLQAGPNFQAVLLGVVQQAVFSRAVERSCPGKAHRSDRTPGVDAVVTESVIDYLLWTSCKVAHSQLGFS